jgi:hypothetical protein
VQPFNPEKKEIIFHLGFCFGYGRFTAATQSQALRWLRLEQKNWAVCAVPPERRSNSGMARL